jgi:hypothetical protein
MRKENIVELVTAMYDGEKVEVSKTNLEIKIIKDEKIYFNTEKMMMAYEFIHTKDVNLPKLMTEGKLPIHIELYSWNNSDFMIRQILRKAIVDELDSQRIALMKHINNFEEIFTNTNI